MASSRADSVFAALDQVRQFEDSVLDHNASPVQAPETSDSLVGHDTGLVEDRLEAGGTQFFDSVTSPNPFTGNSAQQVAEHVQRLSRQMDLWQLNVGEELRQDRISRIADYDNLAW